MRRKKRKNGKDLRRKGGQDEKGFSKEKGKVGWERFE